jgi:hypothetical protein
MSIQRHDAGPLMSKAVVHGDTVYLGKREGGDDQTNIGTKPPTTKKSRVRKAKQ